MCQLFTSLDIHTLCGNTILIQYWLHSFILLYHFNVSFVYFLNIHSVDLFRFRNLWHWHVFIFIMLLHGDIIFGLFLILLLMLFLFFDLLFSFNNISLIECLLWYQFIVWLFFDFINWILTHYRFEIFMQTIRSDYFWLDRVNFWLFKCFNLLLWLFIFLHHIF